MTVLERIMFILQSNQIKYQSKMIKMIKMITIMNNIKLWSKKIQYKNESLILSLKP